MMIILVEKKACTCIPITFMKLPIHDNSGTINDYNSTLTWLDFYQHSIITKEHSESGRYRFYLKNVFKDNYTHIIII